MERRASGVVVLTLAFVLTLAVPWLLEPPLLPVAVALPIPGPPAVGSCLDSTEAPIAAVPCSRPHAAEVAAGWAADDARRSAAANQSNCQAIAFEYVGLTVAGSSLLWFPMFAQRSAILEAPAGERAGDRGWAACIITTRSGESAVGSVRSLTDAPAERPVAFGWCENRDPSGGTRDRGAATLPTTMTSKTVSCTGPHDVEYLSETMGFAAFILADPGLDTTWREGCDDLAASVIGTDDPTFGGGLTIQLIASAVDPESGIDPPSSIAFGRCAAVSTGGRQLTGSLFGLGDLPLPLA